LTKVLLAGLEPETVDFTDPAIPPGMDAAMIRTGIDMAVQACKARGWDIELCMFPPDETAEAIIARSLAGADFDVVVIGAGVRLPPRNLELFERVVNAVHRGAPRTAIAFNTTPMDSDAAAARWLGGA
jgi:hypothetical protein